MILKRLWGRIGNSRPYGTGANSRPPRSAEVHWEQMDTESLGSDSEPGGSSPTVLTLHILPSSNGYDSPRRDPCSLPHSSGPNGTSAWQRTAIDESVAADRPPPGEFVLSSRSDAFRRRHFPDASANDWCDWRWQLRHRLRDLPALARVLSPTADESEALRRLGDHLPAGITPYYASLIDADDPADPFRKMMVPVSNEFVQTVGEADDPLAEDSFMPVPGLVHRYPDRVLFLVTNFCATYCRYCTRARLVGQTGEYHFNTAQYERAIQYIAANPQIRDVLLSGGDPLTMHNERLEWILARLYEIPHVEFLRIGTKTPVVLPQRFTPSLCRMLRQFHPLWLSIHFMHPDEITPEVAQACGRLADAGIPLGAQIVLTRGVNDNVETMTRLVRGLLKIRVRPYYIYQCDPISGSSHFRTPVEKALEIISGLRGHTTGYAVPTLVIDAPGGGGKTPIYPDTIIGRDGDFILLRNYEGKTYRYPDPLPRNG